MIKDLHLKTLSFTLHKQNGYSHIRVLLNNQVLCPLSGKPSNKDWSEEDHDESFCNNKPIATYGVSRRCTTKYLLGNDEKLHWPVCCTSLMKCKHRNAKVATTQRTFCTLGSLPESATLINF